MLQIWHHTEKSARLVQKGNIQTNCHVMRHKLFESQHWPAKIITNGMFHFNFVIFALFRR